MYVCMYVCMYGCMDVCMYACMYTCLYVCMHVCMYACMFVCLNKLLYISVISFYHCILKNHKLKFSYLRKTSLSLFKLVARKAYNKSYLLSLEYTAGHSNQNGAKELTPIFRTKDRISQLILYTDMSSMRHGQRLLRPAWQYKFISV